MEVIILPTKEAGSNKAAEIFKYCIRKNPSIILGLATGSTPLPLYESLIQNYTDGSLDFSQVTSFNLDEYVGVSPNHQASYAYFMKENFFNHINIKPENTFIPYGKAKNIPDHCKDYETLIKDKGGIDIQLLGIGTDGHIGFNEPTSSLASRTRIKTLTRQTIEDNARFFDGKIDDVPKHVITMGIGTIMESKHVILLGFGKNKAQAIKDTIEGPLTASIPASILQTHEQATIIVDEEAASKLDRCDYYKWVYNNRPAWQRGPEDLCPKK